MKLAYLFAHARPYYGSLALVAGTTLAQSAALLAIPWLAAQLIGNVLGVADTNLGLVISLLLFAIVASTALTIASALLARSVSARILADFRTDIYTHVQSLPMAFHDASKRGDLLALMTYEVARLSGFVSSTLATTPALLVTSLGALALLFWIDPVLALLVPVLVPGFYLILKIVGKKMRVLAQQMQAAEAQVMAQAEESLEMLPAIKAFAREEIERERYADLVEVSRDIHVKVTGISAYIGPLTSLAAALAALALILVANTRVQSGDLTGTELFSFLFYTALLTRPIGSLAQLYGQFQNARGTLARLQRVIETASEPGYTAGYQLTTTHGGLEFRDITFTHVGRQSTLERINLSIEPGEIVALTGSNGAGKTTLVNLLLRFYDPASGAILLDGQDITEINVQDLRRQIGYVPQRPLLFNGSIRENIAFGNASANPTMIEAAARLAQAFDFVTALPDGMDTVIGDHGVRLSGGQRQRIALSRALLADPKVLVLDEATSMYDIEGEAAFVEACQTALIGRTVILITHRPASLSLANRVVHMDAGQIGEAPVSDLVAKRS